MAFMREEPDAFSLLDEVQMGTRVSEESWACAQHLSTVIGPEVLIIDKYLEALARAPVEHLRLLERRNARIVFSPTFPDALESPWAAARRGRKLTAQERLRLRAEYAPEAQPAGIFDPELDILVLPTHYVAREDLERVVLHELGHALTMSRASFESRLLRNLPRGIEQHIRQRSYGPDNHPDTLRRRVFEVLAEAYVYLLVGRERELPMTVVSELIFILSTVEEGEKHIRFDFDDETGRTATRISETRLAFPDDPELGHLLAPRPSVGAELEARDLSADDLAVRRSLRRAA